MAETEQGKKDPTPTTAVVEVVKKFLITNREISDLVRVIDASPEFENLKKTDPLVQLKKINTAFDGQLDELIDTLAALFNEYTSLINKSGTKKNTEE